MPSRRPPRTEQQLKRRHEKQQQDTRARRRTRRTAAPSEYGLRQLDGLAQRKREGEAENQPKREGEHPAARYHAADDVLDRDRGWRQRSASRSAAETRARPARSDCRGKQRNQMRHRERSDDDGQRAQAGTESPSRPRTAAVGAAKDAPETSFTNRSATCDQADQGAEVRDRRGIRKRAPEFPAACSAASW